MSALKHVCLAMLAAAGATPTAAAQDDPIAAAKYLIGQGDYDGAQRLLDDMVREPGPEVEVNFLLGMIAMGRDHPRAAIARFRMALVHEPSSIRLRLELGRAFYEARDYENAFRQFQRARAGDPPAPVIISIDRYLAAIRLEKNWSYNFRFSFAPDSNLSSATSSSTTDILGLPFELDENAQRKSGIGLSLEAGTEYAPRIGEKSRMRLGGQIFRREYDGQRFDDMTIVLIAGPRLILSKWDLSLLATGYRRWYGGERYADSKGAQFEVIYYPDSRTQIRGLAFGQQVKHQQTEEEDGPQFGANLSALRALSPSTAAVAKLGFTRQAAREDQFANWSGSLALGYLRDLPGGFTVYVEPSVTKAKYDGEDLLFSTTRSDRIGQLTISVLNRRIVASRFTPRISFTHTRRSSNIDLYDFKKNRIEVGLASDF